MNMYEYESELQWNFHDLGSELNDFTTEANFYELYDYFEFSKRKIDKRICDFSALFQWLTILKVLGLHIIFIKFMRHDYELPFYEHYEYELLCFNELAWLWLLKAMNTYESERQTPLNPWILIWVEQSSTSFSSWTVMNSIHGPYK